MTGITALLSLLLAGATPAELAGDYDGGQTEIAAGLLLHPDGRYRYGMSYGAMDEFAEGSWTVHDGSVELKADTAETNYPDGGKPDRMLLRIDGGDLVIERYDRLLRFRKR